MPKLRIALLLAALTAATPARAQLLPPHVTQGLAAAKVPVANVAVLVQDAGAARPRLIHNPGASMNPASVMKLVTTYAALEILGPAYRWKTEAHLAGTLKGEVLEGDLVLKGSGDPRLDVESFWMLLRALRDKGLREIRGDLLLDRSYYERAEGDAGRFDGDMFRPYNVLPDALLLNYKSVRFSFIAEPERNAVRISAEPRAPTLEVLNNLRLAASGACPEGSAFREMLKPLYEPAQQRVTFSGQFPASCGERHLNVALLEANDHAAGIMRQLWSEVGGKWSGAAKDGLAGPVARLFHVHESVPLAQVVRDVNKFSNNVMARQVFLTLGGEAAGAPASSAKSAAAVKGWLAQKGIAAPELVMDNGSGLSRAERISAHTLAALLQAAWKSAVMPEFIASLPIAGVDGTMRRRVKNEGVAGQAHIKTGLLQDVRSMAGYILDAKGQRVIVVMMINHPNAPQAQGALDALLRWAHGS